MMEPICYLDELIPYQGCAALIGDQQVALFYLPESQPQVYAVQNWDPISKAYVLSRGIVGDVQGVPCVASPMYKQHFNLLTGQCLEEPDIEICRWTVVIEQGRVYLVTNEVVNALSA
ncbi:nitrite reductase small subunit NirD [Vibrio cincinnatiensis]|nr:nitrite reductase small subunit NirD [Vibrio cincinnatiensis]MCG3736013.1 nitrite reductase small subunit NirD [Vibrio cincinnatiensis]MCG3747751.1 nitrite reductase small subunit NirD [Vibrio cincinnatiensis]MCG3765475.1 nitrite reductase small subunit NirD [Vibrio cincinnatiensis]